MARDRNSSIEILRILAMVMIVVGHFGVQSLIATAGDPCNRAVVGFIGSGGRLAVNIFLLIGTWFMVDAPFRPERIIKIYLQVALYTIPLTILMIVLGMAGDARNIIQGLLPFFGRPLWFATAYISLIALTPFLNQVFRLDNVNLGRLVGVLLFCFSAVSTIPSFTAAEYPAELAWFLLVYIFMGWAKRTMFFDRLPSKWWSFALGFGILFALSAARKVPGVDWAASYWLDHLPTLPNFIVAVLIFNFFRSVNLGSVRIVNWMSSSVFAVYIVHQTPAFRECLWNVLWRAETLASAPRVFFVVWLFAMLMALFMIVTAIDRIYRIRLQRLIERSSLYERALLSLNRIYCNL